MIISCSRFFFSLLSCSLCYKPGNESTYNKAGAAREGYGTCGETGPGKARRLRVSSFVVQINALCGRIPDVKRIVEVFPVINKELCISCGRCYRSCMDGGHQAIELDPETRRPRLNGKRCVGCHLCMLVCKVGAIRPGEKVVRRT
ncbi:MAG: 4Fe-4S binding protein [Solobacterium sp.]|nr:4Fe-4S binding protein [Solobacterium sp.]